jgi:transposase
MQRVKDLDNQLDQLAETDDYREIVGILRCFRGIDTLTAISIVAEIFDFGRFSSAREFMSYLGLTPSEDSSGEKKRKGSITKAGNQRVRRLLVEAAWHSMHSYNVGYKLKKRREGQPQWAINIADQAGIRLRKKYYRLISQGKIPSIATVAIAREFAGFIWFIMTEMQKRKVRQVA